MKKISFLSLVLVGVLALVSCSKDGAAGAAGATGPAGPAGPSGSAGATGATGAAGKNASGTYVSGWFGLTFTDHPETDTTTEFFSASIEEPLITDSILNGGFVKVYANIGSDTEPAVVDAESVLSFAVLMLNGGLVFQAPRNFTGLPLRYVIVPAGVAASNKVDWKSYSNVQKFLNIKN